MPRPEMEQAPVRGIVPAPEPAEYDMREVERKPRARDSLQAPETSSVPQARKIHYSADLDILVSQINKAIELAMKLAEDFGGYIERIDRNDVVIQVPAARFKDALSAVEKLGKVTEKRVSSQDVTDAYFDTELRLKNARAQRDRLLQLLEQAKDEDDKLALLKQLEEVSTQIKYLETSMAALKKKVGYSEISIHFRLREKMVPVSQIEQPGFHWIHQLASDNTICTHDELRFDVPKGMLRIENTNNWQVESGDEVVFQTCTRNNEPQGDSAFWLAALKYRMATRFKNLSDFSQGDYHILRMSETPKDAPVYYLGVKADKEKIYYFQVRFPAPALEEKYKAVILNSVAGGARK